MKGTRLTTQRIRELAEITPDRFIGKVRLISSYHKVGKDGKLKRIGCHRIIIDAESAETIACAVRSIAVRLSSN